jgi:hypothetical protein
MVQALAESLRSDPGTAIAAAKSVMTELAGSAFCSLQLSTESVVAQLAGFDRLATPALNGPVVTKAAASDSDLLLTSRAGESGSLPGVDIVRCFATHAGRSFDAAQRPAKTAQCYFLFPLLSA